MASTDYATKYDGDALKMEEKKLAFDIPDNSHDDSTEDILHKGDANKTSSNATADDDDHQDSGKVKDKKVKPTAIQLIKNFGESTSMHGLSHAIGDGPLWRRLFWSALVLSFAVWATYNVIDIIRDFQSSPTLTTVTSEYQPKMPFPAVTICNMNRVRLSKASQNLIANIQLNLEFGADAEFLNTIIDSELRSLSFEAQEEEGHLLEDMLYSCSFNGKPCTAANFSYTFNIRQGNCYTFASSVGSERKEWSTVKAGPNNGLKLELNIEAMEYLMSSTVGGVKVLIHDNAEYPFPEDGGLIVGPGYYTSIGITKTDIKRLPHPYGNCIETASNSSKNLFSHIGFGYSMNGCQKSCFQEYVYKNCSCCDSSYPCIDSALAKNTGKPLPSGGLFFCNTTQEMVQFCVDEAQYQFTSNKLGCTEVCPPACQQSTFSTSVSSGFWPTQAALNSSMQRVMNSGRVQNVSDFGIFFQQSFVFLEVFYESLILEKVDTEPAYTYNKLLGDVGGQLGLLLGFSILTAVEILELFLIDLGLGVGISKLCSRKKKAVGHREDGKAGRC